MRLDSLEQIRTLAERILDTSRTDPVVCVSIRAHDSEPLVDIGALAAAVGELPVYVVLTGELTWELTSFLPDKFDVYGGAARIWWPGLSPGDDPRRHPLVFCWGPYEAPAALVRILRELSRWGWDVAAGPDLTEVPELSTRAYTLLPAPAPISASEDDFPEFVCGQVLDARVVEVFPSGVEVKLPGGVRELVRNRRSTDMPTLAAGDTIPVQVVAVNRAWRTVELCWHAETDPIVPARSVTATPADFARRSVRTGPGLADLTASDLSEPASVSPEIVMLRAQAEAVVQELHDGIAAARSRVEAFAAEHLDDVIAVLSAEVDAARAEAQTLRLQLDAAEVDKRNAIAEMKKQRDRANDFEKQVRKERDRRAYAEGRLNGHGVHDDSEAQLRHEVSVACERIAADLGAKPVTARAYVLGPGFLPSLEALQGIGRADVVEKIARLLLDAPNSYGHPLRAADAGSASQQIRAADGAKAYRLYLQQGTPSARRLHYWQLADSRIELANVGVHDAISIR